MQVQTKSRQACFSCVSWGAWWSVLYSPFALLRWSSGLSLCFLKWQHLNTTSCTPSSLFLNCSIFLGFNIDNTQLYTHSVLILIIFNIDTDVTSGPVSWKGKHSRMVYMLQKKNHLLFEDNIYSKQKHFLKMFQSIASSHCGQTPIQSRFQAPLRILSFSLDSQACETFVPSLYLELCKNIAANVSVCVTL